MGRAGIRRRKPRPARPTTSRLTTPTALLAPTRPLRRRPSHAWWWVWGQPIAVVVVLLVAGITRRPYPTDATESVVLVAVALVTLPGLVAAVVDAVRRHRDETDGARPHPEGPASWIHGPRFGLALAVGGRLILWGFAQAGVDLLLLLVLKALSQDEWYTFAALPVLLGLVVVLGVLAVALVGLGAGLVVVTTRSWPRTGPTALRVALGGLGMTLLGLVLFMVPYGVVALSDEPGDWPRRGIGAIVGPTIFAFTAEGPGFAVRLMRVAVVMIDVGLLLVAGGSPIALAQLVRRRRRAATEDGAETRPVGDPTASEA